MRAPLLLSGFMATGKSTVGRRVAALCGAPFVDLDQLIEQRAGARVADIFQNAGEAEFRRLERAELARLLSEGGQPVVALGGGALLDRQQRLLALEQATVVTLRAPLSTLLARTAGDSTRPLLAGDDREQRALSLLEARRAAYAETHGTIDTALLDPDAAARAALDIWQRSPIAVAAGERSYVVDIGRNLVESLVPSLVGSPTGTLLVTDENVQPLHGDRVRKTLAANARVLVLQAGERHKTVASLERVWSAAAAAELDRHGVVVALGGGVVSDIAGFAAATWMRGTRWVALPTTLLAMVDASVGGKTAVDLGDAKNAVGAFHQPSGVLCDVSLLATEPERGFVSALAEVVKTAILGDAELFDLIEHQPDRVLARDPDLLLELVRRCVAVKASIVSRDERESGLRAKLNLGHTFGHAIESGAGYSSFTHGEAVALGLVAALRIGCQRGVTSDSDSKRVLALLARLGLPTRLDEAMLADALTRVAKDKKRRGTYIGFVLMRAVGNAEIVDISATDLVAQVQVPAAHGPT